MPGITISRFLCLGLLIMLAVSCNNPSNSIGSPSPSPGNNQSLPYQTTLEEASKIMRVKIPLPTYLPDNYSINADFGEIGR